MDLFVFPNVAGLASVSDHWLMTKDGDPWAYEMSRRHYSARRYRQKRQRLFVGPGRKLVLLSSDGLAIFAWRPFLDDCYPRQNGHNCAIFRNEGRMLSSMLVMEAVQVVLSAWGNDRCYTLINPSKIKSHNPGCCFKKAGWKSAGVSKTGKVILEFLPFNWPGA